MASILNDKASGVKPTHFLASSDFTAEQFRFILDSAKALKNQWKTNPQTIHHVENRLMAMIFEKQSLRTRVSFETAFHELGGHASYLTKNDIEMGKRESIADTARVLSQWCTVIVARLNRHKDIEELAKWSSVPVVNALTDLEHPCQALADLQTIEEVFGNKKLKVAWVGDGNNVANSFAVTAARLGHEVVVCTPPGYECAEIVYQHPNVTQQYQPSKAVEGVQVVYTDVWVSMGQEVEAVERMNRFAKYQVDAALMAGAAPDAIFLHCLPAVRGLEVAPEVIDGPQSKVFDQSENRMHAQKALMKALLEGAI
ncbi:MAG TPA: ornithine carbamoyltransferase [Fimbriimonadaceae bacterium]|nr:ornithine carbamoyltransferase [Fimbriimonadaceae bacterium]